MENNISNSSNGTLNFLASIMLGFLYYYLIRIIGFNHIFSLFTSLFLTLLSMTMSLTILRRVMYVVILIWAGGVFFGMFSPATFNHISSREEVFIGKYSINKLSNDIRNNVKTNSGKLVGEDLISPANASEKIAKLKALEAFCYEKKISKPNCDKERLEILDLSNK